MPKQYRTHRCGILNNKYVDQTVKLSGWIHDLRVKKFAIFLDLRDSSGLTQIIIKKETPSYDVVKGLKTESVIQVVGVVVKRKTANPKIATGDIEVVADQVRILSKAKAIPFVINDENNFTALEDLRLKYRYLDLRRKKMHDQLKYKHQVISSVRNFLNSEDFLEVDTPILTKSTPEGARDFLVPSRIKKNAFYALPQSPQLYKQLLMVSGVDRYYQVAKCFRDEDFRADRQPEFQQLDLEMAFANQDDVMQMVEKLLAQLWKDLRLEPLTFPLAQIPYHLAMTDYGTDKPDLRCECKLQQFASDEDVIFRGFYVDDHFNEHTKKAILRIVSQHHGQSFFVYSKAKNQIIFSSSKISLSEAQLTLVRDNMPEDKNLCYLTYEKNVLGAIILGAIRTYYILDQEKQKVHQDFLANRYQFRFLWVIDWPMFELVDNKISAAHHPFTSPTNPELVKEMPISEPEKWLALQSAAYDLVLNGYEVAGGSVRIFDKELQAKIFAILQLDEATVDRQFGFFLEAFDYGIPPHAGIAFGLDRFVLNLTNATSIRDTIAFPKNNSGIDLLTNAPSAVDVKQLEALELKILNDKK